MSSQTRIAIAFLHYDGRLNAMPCTKRRGSADESAVRYLPVGTSHQAVFNAYTDKWEEVRNFLLVSLPGESRLVKKSFDRVWRQHCPQLRIFKKDSDICDAIRAPSSIKTYERQQISQIDSYIYKHDRNI